MKARKKHKQSTEERELEKLIKSLPERFTNDFDSRANEIFSFFPFSWINTILLIIILIIVAIK